MLIITKRDGHQEAFDREKLKTVLAATSDEIRRPLNQSDLDHIVSRTEKILDGCCDATSYDIYVVVVGLLYTRGQLDVLTAYTQHKNNAWNATDR